MASELEKLISRLDIRCDYLESQNCRLPKSVSDSLIKQVREVITEFYSEQRKKENDKGTEKVIPHG